MGAPNAGKSSLLNALAGRQAAIVDATAGTTRDIIETPLVLDGYRVILADMAGLRETADSVEAEGVRRATAWASAADLRLWVVDGSASDGAWRHALSVGRDGDFCLINKADLPAGLDRPCVRDVAGEMGIAVTAISVALDGRSGIEETLGKRVIADMSGSEFPAATRARHATLLQEAHGYLRRGVEAIANPELAAEDVRLAARALERIAGRIGVEDVLDRVFATFCIGK